MGSKLSITKLTCENLMPYIETNIFHATWRTASGGQEFGSIIPKINKIRACSI